MTEVIVWLIVLGLGIAFIGIYALSRQLKEHRRDTAEIMLQSNEMMLDQLKRISAATPEAASATATLLVERRRADRRRHSILIPWPVEEERRKIVGRRAHDLAYVHQMRR